MTKTMILLALLTGAVLAGCAEDPAATSGPTAPACDAHDRTLASEVMLDEVFVRIDAAGHYGGESRYVDLPWAAPAADMDGLAIEATWDQGPAGPEPLWFRVEDLSSGAVLADLNGTSPLEIPITLEDPGAHGFRVAVGASASHGVSGAAVGAVLPGVEVALLATQTWSIC